MNVTHLDMQGKGLNGATQRINADFRELIVHRCVCMCVFVFVHFCSITFFVKFDWGTNRAPRMKYQSDPSILFWVPMLRSKLLAPMNHAINIQGLAPPRCLFGTGNQLVQIISTRQISAWQK